MVGIYCIENKVDSKKYIGLSKDVKCRFRYHKYNLNHNKHINSYLQNSWNKYGKDNFDFYIIEECNENELESKEIYYIKLYKTNNRDYGYNLTSGGDGVLNYHHTDESKHKMSEFWSGKMTGEDNPRSILKECDVLEIIQLLLDGQSMIDIAKQFNVTPSTINGIKQKKQWTHLTQDIEFPKHKKYSKYIGVSWNKRKSKFVALITFDGKRYFIGYFSNEIDAAMSYDKKALELYGNCNDKVKLNFPNSHKARNEHQEVDYSYIA